MYDLATPAIRALRDQILQEYRETGAGAGVHYAFHLSEIEVIPAVRMVRGSEKKNKRAADYLAVKDLIGLAYKTQMARAGWVMIPQEIPLYIGIKMTIPSRNKNGIHFCDWDNLTKTIQDAANRIVFWDDMWIDCCLGFLRKPGATWQAEILIGVLSDL